MKVRELIEELQKLDQERNIWVRYDCFQYFPPLHDDVANEWEEQTFADDGVKKGDYIITAG